MRIISRKWCYFRAGGIYWKGCSIFAWKEALPAWTTARRQKENAIPDKGRWSKRICHVRFNKAWCFFPSWHEHTHHTWNRCQPVMFSVQVKVKHSKSWLSVVNVDSFSHKIKRSSVNDTRLVKYMYNVNKPWFFWYCRILTSSLSCHLYPQLSSERCKMQILECFWSKAPSQLELHQHLTPLKCRRWPWHDFQLVFKPNQPLLSFLVWSDSAHFAPVCILITERHQFPSNYFMQSRDWATRINRR